MIYLMIKNDVFDEEIYDIVVEVLFAASGPLRVTALRLFSLICKQVKFISGYLSLFYFIFCCLTIKKFWTFFL